MIGLVVAGHFPINHHPARASFEDLLDAFKSSSSNGAGGDAQGLAAAAVRLPAWASFIFSVVFVGGCVATAMVVSFECLGLVLASC